MKHEEQQKESSHDNNPQRKQSKQKDKQQDKVTEHKSRIEQMVNTVKEGFTEFNEVLANTLNGTNQLQPQQDNMIQAQNEPINQIKQLDTQVHQAQQTPPMLYTQSFPQNFIHQRILLTNL